MKKRTSFPKKAALWLLLVCFHYHTESDGAIVVASVPRKLVHRHHHRHHTIRVYTTPTYRVGRHKEERGTRAAGSGSEDDHGNSCRRRGSCDPLFRYLFGSCAGWPFLPPPSFADCSTAPFPPPLWSSPLMPPAFIPSPPPSSPRPACPPLVPSDPVQPPPATVLPSLSPLVPPPSHHLPALPPSPHPAMATSLYTPPEVANTPPSRAPPPLVPPAVFPAVLPPLVPSSPPPSN